MQLILYSEKVTALFILVEACKDLNCVTGGAVWLKENALVNYENVNGKERK